MQYFKSLFLFAVLFCFTVPTLTAGINEEMKYSDGTKTVGGICFEWKMVITYTQEEDPVPKNERYWTRPCGSTGPWLLEYDGCPRGSITGVPITLDLQGNGLVSVSSGFGGYIAYVSSSSMTFTPDQSSTIFIEAAVLEYQETCE